MPPSLNLARHFHVDEVFEKPPDTVQPRSISPGGWDLSRSRGLSVSRILFQYGTGVSNVSKNVWAKIKSKIL